MLQIDRQYQASLEHLEGSCNADCPFCALEEELSFEDFSIERKTSIGKAERQIKRRD